MKADKIIVEQSKNAETKANGVIGVNPNKPDFGSIMMSTTSWDSSNGFLNKSRRVYFLSGNIADLEELCGAFGLKIGDDYSAKVAPSRLIVEESTTPFYEGQTAKINPSSGEVIQHNGMDVYRQTSLVAANSAKSDVLAGDTASVTVEELTSDDIPELG